MNASRKPEQRREDYWANVWRQLKKNRPGMIGLVCISLIVLLGAFAPLLANDRPVVAVYDGTLRFPAFTSYVDSWVPWQSLRFRMKSLRFTSSSTWYPMGDNYPELDRVSCRLEPGPGTGTDAPTTAVKVKGALAAAPTLTPVAGGEAIALPGQVAPGAYRVAATLDDGRTVSDTVVRVGRSAWYELDCGDLTLDWKEAHDTDAMAFALWPPVPWSPWQISDLGIKEPPNTTHLLGTDDLGRDVLARLIHGSVVAILVGMFSQAIATGIGVTLGLAAGYFLGWVDLVLSRITEVVMCFPVFFLIIAVISFIEPSIMNIMLVLGLVGWTHIFRLVRGEVLQVRNLDYIAAARSLGMSNPRVMFRHVLPNAISPVFVAIAFGIASSVLVETSLSFLGFGDPTVSSWGEVVQQGRKYVGEGLWHLTIFPGLAIFFTLTAFNLFGQGLRDAMDPKLRQ